MCLGIPGRTAEIWDEPSGAIGEASTRVTIATTTGHGVFGGQPVVPS